MLQFMPASNWTEVMYFVMMKLYLYEINASCQYSLPIFIHKSNVIMLCLGAHVVIIINPLPAALFWRDTNIDLNFVSFLDIEMVNVGETLRQERHDSAHIIRLTILNESNFQTNVSNWWLRYLLWDCLQINVTGFYWW